MAQITNGTARFLQRVKTGDYEHKKASAEFSFSVGEGEDHSGVAGAAASHAVAHVKAMLSGVPANVSTPVGAVKAATKGKDKPPAIGPLETAPAGGQSTPVTSVAGTSENQTPSSAVAEPVQSVDPLAMTDDIPVTGQSTAEMPAAGASAAPQVPTSADPTAMAGDFDPAPTEVTDADMARIVGKKNEALQNALKAAGKDPGTSAPMIKGVVATFVAHPKRMADIPQAQRQSFLTKLEALGV